MFCYSTCLISAFDVLGMSSKVRTYEADSCVVQLKTHSDTTLVALQQMQQRLDHTF